MHGHGELTATVFTAAVLTLSFFAGDASNEHVCCVTCMVFLSKTSNICFYITPPKFGKFSLVGVCGGRREREREREREKEKKDL